jgi:AraC-like DNA-binding protein
MENVSTGKKYDFKYLNYSLGSQNQLKETAKLLEESQENHLPYGISMMKQWMFDGIRILHTKTKYNNHYLFKNHNDDNVVGLEFNIKGRYNIFHHKNIYKVNNQQHNIVYSPGTHNHFENQDLETETFKIEFNPEMFMEITCESNDLLKRFVSQMQTQQPAVLSFSSGIIDLQLTNAMNEILNCRYSGGIKKTFLLSKCLEILVLQAESFMHTEKQGHIYPKNKTDLERLDFARTYIIEHVDMPPSLRELAKLSGLNEYKLKRGFRETYNDTVFGYLTNYRLTTAKKKLESGNLSIAELAYELGFSSPQHFSKTFKERFGMSPKTIRKYLD